MKKAVSVILAAVLMCLSLCSCSAVIKGIMDRVMNIVNTDDSKQTSESSIDPSYEGILSMPSDLSQPDQSQSGDIENFKRIFQVALDKLAHEHGAFDAKQSGTMRRWDDKWLNPNGIMSADIMDFDSDGLPEMLVCYTKPSKENRDSCDIIMSMYEAVDGQAVLTDSVSFDAYTEYDYSAQGYLARSEWSELMFSVNAVKTNGKYNIVCEKNISSHAFVDGESHDYWALVYSDNSFKYECSFTQTSGGSTDFEYTGYEFENGNLTKSDLYYSQMYEYGASHSGKPLYNDYSAAITSFFAKHGIDADGKFLASSPILTSENDKTQIFTFTNKMQNHNESYTVFEFAASLDSAIAADNPSSVDASSNGSTDPAGIYSSDIFPESSSRRMSESELSGITRSQAQRGINEIYARHGYMFKTESLQEFFSAKPYYAPNPNFSENDFSDIEKYNISLFKKFK